MVDKALLLTKIKYLLYQKSSKNVKNSLLEKIKLNLLTSKFCVLINNYLFSSNYKRDDEMFISAKKLCSKIVYLQNFD